MDILSRATEALTHPGFPGIPHFATSVAVYGDILDVTSRRLGRAAESQFFAAGVFVQLRTCQSFSLSNSLPGLDLVAPSIDPGLPKVLDTFSQLAQAAGMHAAVKRAVRNYGHASLYLKSRSEAAMLMDVY